VNPDDILDVGQLAKLLRVGRNAVYDAVGRGEIPHVRVGRLLRFHRRAIEVWLKAGCSSQVADRG
jgi:excisionase family DNA binding protein